MPRRNSRRDFIKTTGLSSFGFWVAGGVSLAQSKSPNEKLNIGVIGCGGKGGSDCANAAATENIVALCDVDEKTGGGTFEKFPKAKRYHDFRKMLEDEKSIDAVTVSTPDHTHAPASVMAMKLGKHVYCQKPLTHSVYEARIMREVAKAQKVATQMGNQGTAENGLRKAVEWIQAGVIGPVREVHVWTNRPIWPQGMDRPKETPSVPNWLDWYLWLGPAADRPYHDAYVPFKWRGWLDFGTGALGDMACHTANMAFMALKLGYPTSVEAESAPTNQESFPAWSTITFQFPARGDMPPVKFVWYDGTKNGQRNKPSAEIVGGRRMSDSGSLLIGDNGILFSPNDYGASYTLLPEEKFKDYKGPEPRLRRNPGKNNDLEHMQEFVQACKGGPAALSNFDYAGLLTETILLGNVAVRVGQKLDWDGPNLKFTNNSDANHFLHREYRKGWTL